MKKSLFICAMAFAMLQAQDIKASVVIDDDNTTIVEQAEKQIKEQESIIRDLK